MEVLVLPLNEVSGRRRENGVTTPLPFLERNLKEETSSFVGRTFAECGDSEARLFPIGETTNFVKRLSQTLNGIPMILKLIEVIEISNLSQPNILNSQ